MITNISTPEELLRLTAAARLVLTCGISGSGKTTLCRVLERRGFRRLSVDASVWARMGAAIPDMPPAERGTLFTSCAAEVMEEALKAVAIGERVVVDSTLCKRAMRDEYRRRCSAVDIVPLIIYLPSDFESLSGRLAARKGEGPDDQIVRPRDLRRYCENFQPPRSDEDAISFSGMKTLCEAVV